jgi:hypothetical protein
MKQCQLNIVLKKNPKTPSLKKCISGRLGEAEREKDIAQLEVVDRIREHEAIKLIRIKEGLFKVNITINAPLILKMRDIIFFFADKLHNGPFQGIFRGGQDFFYP